MEVKLIWHTVLVTPFPVFLFPLAITSLVTPFLLPGKKDRSRINSFLGRKILAKTPNEMSGFSSGWLTSHMAKSGIRQIVKNSSTVEDWKN